MCSSKKKNTTSEMKISNSTEGLKNKVEDFLENKKKKRQGIENRTDKEV